MRVLILGVGDAFTRLHFGSSALIEAPGGYVLLDCPDSIHRCLYEATSRAGWSADASSIDDILLTHLHGDHCNGLESFGFARRILGQGAGPGAGRPRPHSHEPRRRRPPLGAPGPGHGRRNDGIPARSLDDYYEIHEIEPGTKATVAGLTVECRFTQHPVPTLGLLISDGTGTLGWSSDTPFDEAHLQWLSRADVIVHECNRPPMHTPLESFTAISPELTAKIRLNHLPDDFDPSSTAMLPLREGEVLVLA